MSNEVDTYSNSSTWEYLFTDLADKRTNKWFLMSNPVPPLLILASYLYFVKVCGPKFMQNRKPYNLKRILLIYNIFQIIFNLYIFKEAMVFWPTYNWNCQSIDYSDNPAALRVAFDVYLYHINKITDLLDTIFFVLRKKDKQITFLHVFHHTMMVVFSWISVKYFPGGHGTLIGLINTFVHVLLYTYYFLAAFGPEVQKYLWWKKYLTRLQLIQFCIIFLHNLQLLFFDCNFPKWTVLLSLPNASFFFYLFTDFYKKNYTDTKQSDSQKTVKNK